jgi:hypothetical protein
MDKQSEITYEDMRKYLVQSINTNARDIWELEDKLRSENQRVADGKESIVRVVKRFGIMGEEAGHELQRIAYDLDPKNKENKINRLITDALVYVDAEYERGKYEGRDMKTLFGALFEMIGTEAYARFDAAYSLR